MKYFYDPPGTNSRTMIAQIKTPSFTGNCQIFTFLAANACKADTFQWYSELLMKYFDGRMRK